MKGVVKYKYAAAYLLLLAALLLLIRSTAGQRGFDDHYWTAWATYMHGHGLANVYAFKEVNYNPLYLYVLAAYGEVAGSVVRIATHMVWLREFTLLFDFAGALLAVSFVAGRRRRFWLSLLLLLNVAYLYNTMVWGQLDAIHTSLLFGALALALRERPVGSVLLYVLALNVKMQSVLFLPAFLLLWLPQWVRATRSLLLAVPAVAGLQLLILAPFIWLAEQNALPRILEVNLKSVGYFPLVSFNGYNLWYLLLWHQKPSELPDTLQFLGVSYHQWGLLLFMGFSVLALLPLLLLVARSLLTARPLPVARRSLVFLIFGLLPVLFTFFNTQMHERYWHPALLFLAAYCFLERSYLLLALTSVGYLLNLQGVMRVLQQQEHQPYLALPWNPEAGPRWVALVFALVVLLGFWEVYRHFNLRQEWQGLLLLSGRRTKKGGLKSALSE